MASSNAVVDIKGLKGLRSVIDRLSGGLKSTRLMGEIATFLMTEIKLRTAEGKDVNSTAFDSYSNLYAMFRKKKGYPTDKVDLFFTGSMMSSMDYKATSTTAILYFQNTQDKFGGKNPEKAYWLNQKREFFALSAEDMNEVERMVNEEFSTLLR